MRFTPDTPANWEIFYYTQKTDSQCGNFIRKRLSARVRKEIAGVGSTGLVAGSGLDKHWGNITRLKLEWLCKRFKPDWSLSGKDRLKAQCACGLKKSWIINIAPIACPMCGRGLEYLEVYQPRRKSKKIKVSSGKPPEYKMVGDKIVPIEEPYRASYRDGKPRAVPREHRW